MYSISWHKNLYTMFWHLSTKFNKIPFVKVKLSPDLDNPPEDFSNQFKLEILKLPKLNNKNIIKVFKKYILHYELEFKEELFLKGTTDDILKWVGDKIAKSMKKLNYFRSFEIVITDTSDSKDCPTLNVMIFRKPSGYTICFIAKNKDGELILLNSFNPFYYL